MSMKQLKVGDITLEQDTRVVFCCRHGIVTGFHVNPHDWPAITVWPIVMFDDARPREWAVNPRMLSLEAAQ